MLGTTPPPHPLSSLALSFRLGTGLGAFPPGCCAVPGGGMAKLWQSPALGRVALSGDTSVVIAGGRVSLILTTTLLPPLSLPQPLLQDGALLAALPCRGWGPSPPPNLPWDSAAWGDTRWGGRVSLGSGD